jgi:hypothetical protein
MSPASGGVSTVRPTYELGGLCSINFTNLNEHIFTYAGQAHGVATTAYAAQPKNSWVLKMSSRGAESYVRLAKQQVGQADINGSLLKAIDELLREVKHLNDEVRKARRDLWFNRRTG